MDMTQISSFLVLVVVSTGLVGLSSSQNMRVAPGVPPQHYDSQQYGQGHAPPPQHQQQQYQQHQQFQQPPQFQQPQHQVPVQQQQVPFQQPGHGHVPQQQQPIHTQIPQQQPPPHGHVQQPGGHPHAHGGPPQVLDTSNIGQERQHIQDHMSVPIDTSQMNEQELQFHYFKMHDADNNNKLDGCELVKSLIHWHDESNHDPKSGHPVPEPKLFKDDELMNMIDPILDNDDKNRDGFIDYGEFVQAQAAAASRSTAQHAA